MSQSYLESLTLEQLISKQRECRDYIKHSQFLFQIDGGWTQRNPEKEAMKERELDAINSELIRRQNTK